MLPDTSALQWTAQTSQQTTMTVCRGQDLELDWGYTLRDGETAEDKRWDVVTDHSQEVMAMSVRVHISNTICCSLVLVIVVVDGFLCVRLIELLLRLIL